MIFGVGIGFPYSLKQVVPYEKFVDDSEIYERCTSPQYAKCSTLKDTHVNIWKYSTYQVGKLKNAKIRGILFGTSKTEKLRIIHPASFFKLEFCKVYWWLHQIFSRS